MIKLKNLLTEKDEIEIEQNTLKTDNNGGEVYEFIGDWLWNDDCIIHAGEM